jgi:hemophore
VAKAVGTVANSTGAYLDSHPQTNQALTTISQQQGGPQSLVALKTYFDANPAVAKDMQTLQRPLTDLSGACRLPVTVPQILGLLQGAQQGGGLTAGLPASLPGAQSAGLPGASSPAQRSPASAVVGGSGPLPGPATVGTR